MSSTILLPTHAQLCIRYCSNKQQPTMVPRHPWIPVVEEQSWTRGSQSGGVEDQLQCRGMWQSISPSARSLSRSPSPPPPSSRVTQSPTQPPHSLLVRDGQTSPHRPRLVVSRSTCPPLSPSPHANSFMIGTAVTNTHTPNRYCSNNLINTHIPQFRHFTSPMGSLFGVLLVSYYFFPLRGPSVSS